MTEQQAKEHIAAVLAMHSMSHIESAEKHPTLKQNMEEAIQADLESARVLGIEAEYIRHMQP